jgi:drug/metabolite transporter (DMT)-like permease
MFTPLFKYRKKEYKSYMLKSDRRAGIIGMLSCACLWSSGGLCIKLLDWNPLVIAQLKSVLSALLLGGLALGAHCFRKRRGLDAGSGVKRSRRSWFFVFASGFAYGLQTVLFVLANKMTTAANTIILQYSSPIWAAIAGWFILKEKPSLWNWISMVMVFAGMALMMGEDLETHISGLALAGDIIAVLAGVAYGTSSSLLKSIKEGSSSDGLMAGQFMVAIVLIPALFIYPPSFRNPGVTLGAILFLGLIQSGVTCLLFGFAVIRIKAVESMIFAIIEPLLNPLWVFIGTGEAPGPAAYLGGAIIIAAVLLSGLAPSRNTH